MHKNESREAGQSITQYPKTNRFCYDDVTIRLIDTPEIGDTREIDQDKATFQNILIPISTLDTLHDICILLKPNATRLTVMFQYCIKKLLINLHRDECPLTSSSVSLTRGEPSTCQKTQCHH